MANYLWIFWAILGAVLVVAEVFTTGFVLLWFGVGALAAGLAGLLGVHSIILQFLIFAIVSISLTAASRTIFVNYFSRQNDGDVIFAAPIVCFRYQGVARRAKIVSISDNLSNVFIAKLAR